MALTPSVSYGELRRELSPEQASRAEFESPTPNEPREVQAVAAPVMEYISPPPAVTHSYLPGAVHAAPALWFANRHAGVLASAPPRPVCAQAGSLHSLSSVATAHFSQSPSATSRIPHRLPPAPTHRVCAAPSLGTHPSVKHAPAKSHGAPLQSVKPAAPASLARAVSYTELGVVGSTSTSTCVAPSSRYVSPTPAVSRGSPTSVQVTGVRSSSSVVSNARMPNAPPASSTSRSSSKTTHQHLAAITRCVSPAIAR